MVLTCDGPDKLFDSHKLVMKTPFSDSRRVGVFCARREWPGGASSCRASASASQTLLSPLVRTFPFLPAPLATLTTAYKQPLLLDTTNCPGRRLHN